MPNNFPNVTGPTADELRDYMRRAQGTNLGLPGALLGVDGIDTYYGGRGEYGFVSNKKPTVVNASSEIFSPDKAADVIGHEAQHVQNNVAWRQKYADQKNDSLLQSVERNFGASDKDARRMQQQIEDNYQAYVKQWRAEQTAKPNNFGWAAAQQDALGPYSNTRPGWEERLASLTGLETKLPKGQRIADTELGKAVLNTPELQNYYYQSARPLEAKMLPQPDTQLPLINKLRQVGDLYEMNQREQQGFVPSIYNAIVDGLLK